ncbi:hypothetical protein SmJEL517_g02053 [Synchytrium microbalum]|uniref:Prokaryotic-type class I peptide chain release factors domain-containing protein n=1 Tax=Synchytrium microbalum TaxID=1806994 RepID=A0A507C2W1_9FUNG|nr:uncharacterized protein SmJEL517_g02053 [Synchytrium microbalum]TPX35467.1 hypothetical protein SmJEL517_g02053 [Synchytrium microbalum]
MVSSHVDWASKQDQAHKLDVELDNSQIWENDASRAIQVQKKLAELRQDLAEYKLFTDQVQDMSGMLELAREEGDAALIQDVSSDILSLKDKLQKYSVRLLMSDPEDQNDCFLEFKSGAGGAEAGLFAVMLIRMYERWAASTGRFEATILDSSSTDHDGIKAATLQISGPYAYGWLRHEAGIHRLVRVSPLDANGRRHTSFVSVLVYPDASVDESSGGEEVSVKDVKIEVMRAQGAGGQHVNKTESAVRLTHIPTGIIVACQFGRSQHQNRALAFKLLKAKLMEREMRARAQVKSDLHSALPDNNFGSQIRSYVLQPYQMIKDLRTGYEQSDIDGVLEGGDLQREFSDALW